MKKAFKSKIGFTLIEIVLAIAIIVILTAVLALQIGGYFERANNAASSVSFHNSILESATVTVV